MARGAVESNLLLGCSAFPTGFYDVRPQQMKRKKPPVKKLILEQEVEKLSAGKSFGLEQERGTELAAMEGRVPPGKEEFLEPPLNLAGDPQPHALLEELMKDEKDWVHGAQGAGKPAGDDPQLKEQEQCSGGRKSPGSCSTLDQSEGEDASRGSSQLSGECLKEWSLAMMGAKHRSSLGHGHLYLHVVLVSSCEGVGRSGEQRTRS